MMAERLAEIRRDLCTEAYTSYLPKTVRELLDHIAQLEAQRGKLARELDLTKREAWTAKERHKDEKDRADGLRERLDEQIAKDFARAQRGGAVVVPAWNRSDFDKVPPEWSEMQCFGAGYELAVSRIQPIPADRVLGEGMVGVDRETITRLSTAIDDVVITSAHHAIGSIEDKAVSVLCMAFSPIAKALRAQQVKGE